MSKFREGDKLIYVNPFIFLLEKVQVEFSVIEHDRLYWIDSAGAYLAEENLFFKLDDAKQHAHNLLDKFYIKHRQIIDNYKEER